MRVSLRSPDPSTSMTFERFASSQFGNTLTTTVPPKSDFTAKDATHTERFEPSLIPGLITPQGSFDLHRFMLLTLMRSAAERSDIPGSGAAILMRVVYPPVAMQRGSAEASGDEGNGDEPCDAGARYTIESAPEGWPHADARFDPLVAVQHFDVAATLSAPHPLYETLMRWAAVPEAFAAGAASRNAINQRSIIHLAFAPRMPGNPILVLSVNAAGQYTSHMHFQNEWRACERQDSVNDALRCAHLKAAGLLSPAAHDELLDTHDQLRIRALAQRAAAITLGEITADQPHIASNLLGKSPLQGRPALCTWHEIEQEFQGLVVSVALRETQRHYARVRHPLGLWD